mgnify:CR=1 FL=1
MQAIHLFESWPFFNIGFYVRMKSFAFHVSLHMSHHLTFSLQHTKNYSFSCSSTPTLFRTLATDIGLISIDCSRLRRIAISLPHVLTNLRAYTPGRFVGDTQLTLQLLGWNSMAGRNEQIHRITPFLQRHMRGLERSVCHRVNMMATP